GLPKAARIPHSRARTYMRAFAGATASTPKDALYNCLPLYHSTGGLVGVGSVLFNGGRLITRRRFAATHFCPDVTASGAPRFFYIDELVHIQVTSSRYVEERAHTLRMALGNSQGKVVWLELKGRFLIKHSLEVYDSTAGNFSLFNFDRKAGDTAWVPRFLM